MTDSIDRLTRSAQGSIPLLTVPENLERVTVKCSDNHDQVVANRFNPNYRFTVRERNASESLITFGVSVVSGGHRMYNDEFCFCWLAEPGR